MLAFLTSVAGPPVLNIANAGTNCSLFAGTDLPRCPQLEYASPHLDRFASGSFFVARILIPFLAA